MRGVNFVEYAVADGLARGHDEMLTVRDDKGHVRFGYPTGLRRWHDHGRTVFLRLAGHRPFDRGRRIATAGFAVQVHRLSLFCLVWTFDAHVTRTVCVKDK